MPELPEVETTLRGIQPYLEGRVIDQIVINNPNLRWPIPVQKIQSLIGQKVVRCTRRAKYLLIEAQTGILLLHLGMSGSLRVVDKAVALAKHDHVDIGVGEKRIRFNDPRRFGCLLYMDCQAQEHQLLAKLGPEPLSADFSAQTLFECSRKRKISVKALIMDAKVVVGVGNIYASEALFLAKIRPSMQASRVSRQRYQKLAQAIKQVLTKAIEVGGTTLKDFTKADGKPGYFSQQLLVYGRAGEACKQCNEPIKSQMIAQRNTYFCPNCQRF